VTIKFVKVLRSLFGSERWHLIGVEHDIEVVGLHCFFFFFPRGEFKDGEKWGRGYLEWELG
jgi:hypothetical protein